jgi:predicted AlkP superfamily phosphohydrolase/phosphomutase
VDWSKTRAFAVGLGGIYLNLRGRRAQGAVQPGEEERELRRELQEKLRALRDDADDASAVAEVYDLKELYEGPYVGDAPDLLVGFRVGWRVSWDCAVGIVNEEVFEDNVKSWSGDHCMNPPDVPGIFFCNRKLSIDNGRIDIKDIGPTVLDLFGVPVPPYCDGKPRLPASAEDAKR